MMTTIATMASDLDHSLYKANSFYIDYFDIQMYIQYVRNISKTYEKPQSCK